MSESLLISILESFLGEHRKLNEDTGQVSFDCPACSYDKDMPDGDGKGNLEVNYNKGVYKCWACKETNNMYGPVIKLLKKYANPKITRDYLLIKPESTISIDGYEIKRVTELPEGYKKLSECNAKDFKSKIALNYLYERGVTDEIIKQFDIGYTYKGKFFNRIIIPSYDKDGDLNYFIARWFDKKYTKIKYLNPEAEKEEIIFNEYKVNLYSTIYLVEGVFDHIVTPNSIPLLGKYVSSKLLEFLHDNAMGYIVIFLDDDAHEDAVRLYHELNFGDLRGRIKLIHTPYGYDASKIYEFFGNQGIIRVLKSATFL
jgi:DNA primase